MALKHPSTDMPTSARGLESMVENHLAKLAAAHGILCTKFVSPGLAGVPDRFLSGYDHTGASLIIFVEVKRPGGRLSPRQKATARIFRRHGSVVLVSESKENNAAIIDKFYLGKDVPNNKFGPSSKIVSQLTEEGFFDHVH